MTDKLNPCDCYNCDNYAWCKLKDGIIGAKLLFPDIKCRMYTPKEEAEEKLREMSGEDVNL